MQNFKLALIGVIAAIVAAPAFAAPIDGSATLAAPARADRVVSENGIWHCAGDSCTGTTLAATGAAVAACTAVAAVNGRVNAFAVGGISFGEAELKRCNRHVKS
ncbi:CC_3452 family protein [Glacieibacterium sp.]|uniref:CC_3452 family protein n=1 Tax=Glacieibacterium sp. TaxID=2860237 RepID=UPI003AFF7E3B